LAHAHARKEEIFIDEIVVKQSDHLDKVLIGKIVSVSVVTAAEYLKQANRLRRIHKIRIGQIDGPF
jgi:hypothetical protein